MAVNRRQHHPILQHVCEGFGNYRRRAGLAGKYDGFLLDWADLAMIDLTEPTLISFRPDKTKMISYLHQSELAA